MATNYANTAWQIILTGLPAQTASLHTHDIQIPERGKLQQDAADVAAVSQGKCANVDASDGVDTANVNALMVFQAAGSFF